MKEETIRQLREAVSLLTRVSDLTGKFQSKPLMLHLLKALRNLCDRAIKEVESE